MDKPWTTLFQFYDGLKLLMEANPQELIFADWLIQGLKKVYKLADP